jgi:hypothetical protein
MSFRIFVSLMLGLALLGCDSKPKPVTPVTTGSATPPAEAANGAVPTPPPAPVAPPP